MATPQPLSCMTGVLRLDSCSARPFLMPGPASMCHGRSVIRDKGAAAVSWHCLLAAGRLGMQGSDTPVETLVHGKALICSRQPKRRLPWLR